MGSCGSKGGRRTAVKLHVYDISGGRAASLSEALLARRIEGVWHTGIVVHGREYYYGGGHGIESTTPGHTPYGTPVQVIDLGKTATTPDAFRAFLLSIDDRFQSRHYHLFDHNCNSFTDECSRFLLGKGIPDWISKQHLLFLDTDLGRKVGPVILALYNALFGVQVRTGVSVHTRPRREREIEAPVNARGLPSGYAARGPTRRDRQTVDAGRRRGTVTTSSHSSASYDTTTSY